MSGAESRSWGISGLRPMLAVCLSLVCVALTGCGASRRTLTADELPFPALTEPREALIERIAGLQSGISTLLSTAVSYDAIALGQTTGEEVDNPDTEGVLVVERPSHIHMTGKAFLQSVTIFDMVSDGREFRVSAPARGTFITGANDSVTCAANPVSNLRPQHIMDALFVDTAHYAENPDIIDVLEEFRDGRISYYVVSFIDAGERPARLLEKVWVDRRDLTVSGKQLYSDSGSVETGVTYSEWEQMEGSWFPHRVSVERPVEDYRLDMRFGEVLLNEDIPETAFLLARPVGSELITVESFECGRGEAGP